MLVAASLLLVLNAHASYRAEVLANWFTLGTTKGVDTNGKTCEVIMGSPLGLNGLFLNMANMESHKTPRFNSYVSNILEEIKETSTSLYIVLKSSPTNSYTSAVKQTLSVTKTSNGTVVSITEKKTRLFGASSKATCIIH